MNSETVERYLDYYGETQGLLPEKLEKFREAYSEKGFLTREQLYELAFESSTRSAYHVRKNPEQRCRDVTANILKLEDDFSQIALIEALKGFKAPTASVILTVKDPERHAVVDTRVWASLERFGYLEGRKESFTAEDYVKMIEPIREIAKETGFTTEDIGYALFAMDVEKRKGNLH
jgi:thermostable 8-oxoguanine DNA glycosylase